MLFAARDRDGILSKGALPANRLPKACPLKRRALFFRLTAVLLGLSVFAAFEATCRVAGWGAEPPVVNAWQQFSGTFPLFEMTADGRDHRIATNRRSFFADDRFPVRKSAATRRIFVFGGSTVQGRPFSTATSFTTFLKLALSHAVPETDWEVVNCGGISYASYRLLPVMQECLQYQPDLFVVCTGHNEFLECVTYSKVTKNLPVVQAGRRWLDQMHSFRLLQQAWPDQHDAPQHTSDKSTPRLPEEVDALLDHQGGLNQFTRSNLHRSELNKQFENNLHHMAEIADSASVPLIMMSPPVNLRDCPPFKSEFTAESSAMVREQVAAQLKTASDRLADDLPGSIALLEHTTQLDARFAFTWYQLGQAYLQAHRIDEAKAALQNACDEDVCPLRMTTELRNAMQRVVQQRNLPYINVQQMMEADSRHGIVGDFVLTDHVHPSFGSHQRIAMALVEQVCDPLHCRTTSEWKPAAQSAFDDHLQSLDDMYFLRGRRTLDNLRAWTQGRADGPPLPKE